MDEIDICLVTWPNHPRRIEYFRSTLRLLRVRLCASGHIVNWYCSSESERDHRGTWHGNELDALCAAEGIRLSYRNGPASVGANMNAAMRLGMAPYVFLVQDDFELARPCDLSPGVRLLAEHAEVDLVRYSWPAHLVRYSGEIAGFRILDINGPWPYGDDPQLRRRSFTQKWGQLLEGGPHGVNEPDMCRRFVARKAVVAVADERPFFGHKGAVSSVPLDKEYRNREVSR